MIYTPTHLKEKDRGDKYNHFKINYTIPASIMFHLMDVWVKKFRLYT